MEKKKPIILAILDGFGYRKDDKGNAIRVAKKPNIMAFFNKYPTVLIDASGEAVGLPEGQMGNSEVGHMNIGAGRIVYQSLTYINNAIKDGSFFKNPSYLRAMEWTKTHNSKLHIFGLTSDGGVHSHLNHIKAIIKMAKDNGVKELYFHAFMDGRDVDPQNGPKYIKEVVDEMKRVGLGELADIGGRYYVMDRDKNLDRVDVAYRVMVDHDGPSFTDYEQFFKEEYENLKKKGMEPSDEFLTPTYNANVDGRIRDNDAVIFMNFRPDRAIQISTILTNPHFYENPPLRDGKPIYKPYVPEHILENIFLVATMKFADSVKGEIAMTLPKLDNGLGVWLAEKGYTQLRIAETEKYAHVTFFFDGTVNYDGVEKPELKGARRVLINSPKVATYDLMPEMSANKVTDALLKELDKGDLDVVILNFANCDMVGHTAIFDAVVKAVETVDTNVGRIVDWVNKNGGVLMITADHGNAEQLIDEKGNPYTAHTTNQVPFSINLPNVKLREKGGRLSNIAPTILDLLGVEKPKEMVDESLIIKE